MDFKLGDLISGTIRQATAPGGLRKIARGVLNNTNQNGGILGVLSSAFGWLVGAVLKGLESVIQWTLTGLWTLIVQVVSYIWNFNFNQPSNQWEKELDSLVTTSAALLGFTVGQAIGYLGCGVLPGLAIFAFNEALAVHVLNEVGEKALHTLCAGAGILVQNTFQQGLPVLIDYLYVQARSAALPLFVKAGWISAADAKKVGTEDAKPWSFALATQEAIHSIKNKNLRTLVEVAFQTAQQTCVEAGYVVASSIEEYIAKQKAAHTAISGPPTAFEIVFNRKTATKTTP